MLSFGLRFLPVKINVLSETGGKDADPSAGFDLAPIIADIVDAGFRISRDPMGTGRVRTIIESRRRDRHRKSIEAATFLIQLATRINNILTFRSVHSYRSHRLG